MLSFNLCLCLLVVSFFKVFWKIFIVYFSFPPRMLCMSRFRASSNCSAVVGRECTYKLWRSSSCDPPNPCCFLSPGSEYTLHHFVLKHPHLYSSFMLKGQVSHPYETTDNVSPSFSVFWCLGRKERGRNTEDSEPKKLHTFPEFNYRWHFNFVLWIAQRPVRTSLLVSTVMKLLVPHKAGNVRVLK